MADKKISALTGATTPLAGTEVLPIVQGSATVKVSVANLTAGRAVAMAGGSFTDNVTQSTAAKGINFTANTPAAGMTSQLLNWYEEGTWTPTDGSGAGLSFTIAGTSTYTRIGRQVICRAGLSYPATASADIAQIGGLPFATAANGGASGQMFISACSSGTAIQGGYVGSSSTTVLLAGPAAALVQNSTMSGSLIYFTVIYSV